MKILYIDEPLDPPGGGQVSLLTLLKNLDVEKFKFLVVLSRDGIFKSILEKNKIPVVVATIPKLIFIISDYNPDLLHINSACTKYTFISALAGKIFGKKIIWHNRVVETSPFKEKLISLLVNKIIVTSDAVMTKFKYTKNKIVKLYNPVDIENIRFNIDSDKLKRNLDINEGAKVIGVFSRLEKWKGHEILFNAFSKLQDKNIYLLICGTGKEEKNLKKLALELGIKDNVRFCGYIENVYDYMNICDVIVNPSVEPEPFGRTIIEGMVLGKTIIATNLGGPREIIQHMVDGILVEPNPFDLINALKLVLYDDDLRLRISKNAKLKSEIFCVKNYVTKIIELYRSL
ncbi:MAG: glycosyltransferase [Endomicrobia bacterium]|nr:glycosyltransferase [Endomicrobiia bacterium]